ncbi:TPA: hypothetical protein ACXM9H_000970 [Burkholderia multivorans]|uniref:hypothetical protein n=1 Tax=Burkholderia multivorans TaxID=87883 RepID=UPI000D003C65|nr:hypothetical protein [Burkholderia multivorans]PRD74792.1 hypothetical protein C6P75_12440 [Burkholderia multivorans]
MRPDPHTPLPPPPRAASVIAADQVRIIRIAALELLLAIELSDVHAEPTFVSTLHRLSETPIPQVVA